MNDFIDAEWREIRAGYIVVGCYVALFLVGLIAIVAVAAAL